MSENRFGLENDHTFYVDGGKNMNGSRTARAQNG
jgi:hypothetical protein